MSKSTYDELINSLSELLNSKRDGERAENLKKILKELKTEYKQEISTKFLRNLINGLSFRQKTYRVKYLLRRAGLKTTRVLRFYKTLTIQKYKTEIKEFVSIPFKSINKEYLLNDGELKQYEKITKPYGLTEEEKEQLKEIEQVKQETDGLICLYPKALRENEEKNRIRTAVYNKNCGITRLKNYRTETIGKEFLGYFSEVLFIIRV